MRFFLLRGRGKGRERAREKKKDAVFIVISCFLCVTRVRCRRRMKNYCQPKCLGERGVRLSGESGRKG